MAEMKKNISKHDNSLPYFKWIESIRFENIDIIYILQKKSIHQQIAISGWSKQIEWLQTFIWCRSRQISFI